MRPALTFSSFHTRSLISTSPPANHALLPIIASEVKLTFPPAAIRSLAMILLTMIWPLAKRASSLMSASIVILPPAAITSPLTLSSIRIRPLHLPGRLP